MKKVILSAAILLGSLSTFTASAQVQNTVEKTVTTTQEYTEIKLEELPAVVNEALKKSFPDAKLTKAYINEKKEYKLEVEVGDKVGSLFIDANGKWIKK
jgi:hypothetical protein